MDQGGGQGVEVEMSVGGKAIEIIPVQGKIWVNTYDGHDECAIYVKPTAEARCVEVGDSFWWQGGFAYWTPKKHVNGPGACDIKIPRIGGSGVSRPV